VLYQADNLRSEGCAASDEHAIFDRKKQRGKLRPQFLQESLPPQKRGATIFEKVGLRKRDQLGFAGEN